MSRFFDDLEAQLRAAAVARSAGRPAASRRTFRRLRRGARLAPVLVAVFVALAVAAVVLTTIGSGGTGKAGSVGGHPGPGGNPYLSPVEAKYVNEAINATIRRDPACAPRGAFLERTPRFSYGKPSEALLSILGVLRRPATPADRPPRFLFDLGPGPGPLYIHYVRLARVYAGVPYYVVVARIPGSPPRPRRCFAEIRAAARKELPTTLPKPQRTRILAVDLGFLQQGRDVPRHAYDGVFLFGRGGGGGGSASQIEQGGAAFVVQGQTISGVVPDGVATVELPLRPVRGYPHLRLAAKVINNVFVAQAPVFDLPTAEVWLSPTGAVIHRVDLNR